MKDIEDLEDIKTFVDAFYAKIRADELLAPVFALKIASSEWDKHLQRMYNFWNTVLFFQRSYKGNPFSKHTQLPIEYQHFTQWILLFETTIDEHFKGDKANEVKSRANKMASMFLSKLAYLTENKQMTSIL